MDPEADRAHWETVWQQRTESDVSWFQAAPEESLRQILATGVPPTARIIDVGAGASRLVDRLLAEDWSHVTVLDIAGDALVRAQERLGADAARVRWEVGDVRTVDLETRFDVWHDRAVFHFLIDPEDRRAYVENMWRHLAPKGHAIIATFASDGPTTCSGLPVMRHDAASLEREVGDRFRLASVTREVHRTPRGEAQPFIYGRFWKRPEGGDARLVV